MTDSSTGTIKEQDEPGSSYRASRLECAQKVVRTCLKDMGTGLEGFLLIAAAAAKLLQLCLTLCDPTDSSSVPGILQARILKWVAISFSSACMLSHFSHVQLCAAPWTAAP